MLWGHTMWQHRNFETMRTGLTNLIFLVFRKVGEEIRSAVAGCFMEAFLAPIFPPCMAG